MDDSQSRGFCRRVEEAVNRFGHDWSGSLRRHDTRYPPDDSNVYRASYLMTITFISIFQQLERHYAFSIYASHESSVRAGREVHCGSRRASRGGNNNIGDKNSAKVRSSSREDEVADIAFPARSDITRKPVVGKSR